MARFKKDKKYFWRKCKVHPPFNGVKSDYETTNSWFKRFIIIQLAKIVLPHICSFNQSRTIVTPKAELWSNTLDNNMLTLFSYNPTGLIVSKMKLTKGDLSIKKRKIKL